MKTDKKSLSILLADDSVVNRMVMEDFFEHLGYENVTMVENGQEAIEKIEQKKYDIVFMDVHMPVMDGITAIKKIVSFEDKPIIILLTADIFIPNEDLKHIDDQITKPIKLETLQASLDKWLQKV